MAIRPPDSKICFNSLFFKFNIDNKLYSSSSSGKRISQYYNGINSLMSEKQEPNITRRTIQLNS